MPLATLNARDACRCRSCAWVSGSGIVLPRALAGDALSPGQTLVDTFFDSHFLGERVGQKTQKQGGVNLSEVCKIRFLMAGTQRLVFAWPPRPGAHRPRGPPCRRASGEGEKNGYEA